MAYSDEALAFATIPVNHQIRLEDRISYLYLEYATIRQDRTGVVAYSSEEGENIAHTIQIPVAEIAVIVLGPGTSISHAAMTSCARAGATVIFGGGGGLTSYTVATPLTTSSKWPSRRHGWSPTRHASVTPRRSCTRSLSLIHI